VHDLEQDDMAASNDNGARGAGWFDRVGLGI
jgi:hypothetical protein